MQTTWSPFLLAGQTIHCVDFLPETFTDADLLWLPHHAQLTGCGRKRKTEHLAGRIAAAHALHALNERRIPARGAAGEPIWPEGIRGSISHSGRRALAVALRQPQALVGIDCDALLSENEANEIQEVTIDSGEARCLVRSGFAFPLALTLAFSAKESLYKALFPQVQRVMGFDCARVSALDDRTITLVLPQAAGDFAASTRFVLHWTQLDNHVCTLMVRETRS